MTLIEHLTLIEETRSDINRKHDLVDVMFLVISAIMARAEGWHDIETYGDAKADWLRQYRPFTHGIPRRHTIARILSYALYESFLEALASRISECRISNGQHIITLNGKVLRGSYRNKFSEALQLVTAYDTENGLVLSQKATPSKKERLQRSETCWMCSISTVL